MKFINCATALTPTGWRKNLQVGINERGLIGYVGVQTSSPDHSVDLLLPAPANLHSHAFQRAISGLTEMRGPSATDSFWTWRTLMYRFLDRLDPEQIEAVAALAFMEMLASGFGSVAEFHYVHHSAGGEPYAKLSELSDRIVVAAETTGIGLTLLPVLYEFGGCNRRSLKGGQLRFKNDIDRYGRLHEQASASVGASLDDCRIGIAPHSLRATGPDGLRQLQSLCCDGPMHIHIAEQVAEVEEVQSHRGARPIEWLLANHEVDENWCLIHCTQMTGEETRNLARTGAVAGLCPITESNLGDGIFNGVDYFSSGGRAGVGSDSNIHISLFDELKTLEYSQRLRDGSRAALATAGKSTGRVLFEAVSGAGAQAAGRPGGMIEAGMLADLIGLSADNRWIGHLKGDMILDGLIFGGFGQQCISDVWSAGRHAIRDGRHPKQDAITSAFRAVMTDIGDCR